MPIKSLWSDRKATFRSLHWEPDELPAPCPPPHPSLGPAGRPAGQREGGGLRKGEQEPPLLRRWLAAADAWVSSHVCPSDLINGPLRCKATPARQSASSFSACLATPHCSPPLIPYDALLIHLFCTFPTFSSLSCSTTYTQKKSDLKGSKRDCVTEQKKLLESHSWTWKNEDLRLF